MFIELHMLQNFVPSNLNRDDTGSPKDCEFGGHRRARISSQALKRAIRNEPIFAATTEVPVGHRSKWMMRPIAERLVAAGKTPDAAETTTMAFVAAYAAKMDGKEKRKTSVLIYFSEAEIDQIASVLLDNWGAALDEAQGGKQKVISDLAKEVAKQMRNRTSAPDIALFGRMLAEKPDLNIDAACQVSHAISTHRVSMDMDYYTAVDELLQDEEAGAGMVGFTGFNSACFYRYARIDWELLVANLSGNITLARRTVEGFLRAAINALPTGKQNAFAAQNPTNFALAVVRADGKSWNLANAFETPVRPGRDVGQIGASITALDAYWRALVTFYDDAQIKAVAAHTLQHADALDALRPALRPQMSAWLAAVIDALPQEA